MNENKASCLNLVFLRMPCGELGELYIFVKFRSLVYVYNVCAVTFLVQSL
jgi:hypothetical protein